MGSQGPSKRLFCLACSKPARLCLCSRFESPPIDNVIGVTILQHSLEVSHPLNSTRIAKLGLKNISLFHVTDVNFQARFLIRPLEPSRGSGSSSTTRDARARSNFSAAQTAISGDSGQRSAGRCENGECGGGFKNSELVETEKLDLDGTGEIPTVTMDKCQVACSPSEIKITIQRAAKPSINSVLGTPVGREATSNGFMVAKLQRKQLRGSEEFQDFQEYEITIPPGSAVLFPYEKSISLDAVDFEVKHLVVLDGTWAKAKRMYHENPWLKLLPHLKLDPGKESLYSEVRHQPKAGCLSTIESIVCALKGLGNDVGGLDNLLDVFESMIRDQRNCKDEKFRAMAQ
ncbi:uncharacterized protein [Typha latifolia]|uniref:uncharacterized protein n=1 Tax=Typha latifolia TaxID=4733 RepID=UPI003C2E226C